MTSHVSQKVPSVHISPHLMGLTSVLQLAADTGFPKRSDELNLESESSVFTFILLFVLEAVVHA